VFSPCITEAFTLFRFAIFPRFYLFNPHHNAMLYFFMSQDTQASASDLWSIALRALSSKG
jgi:hypothetical protein